MAVGEDKDGLRSINGSEENDHFPGSSMFASFVDRVAPRRSDQSGPRSAIG